MKVVALSTHRLRNVFIALSSAEFSQSMVSRATEAVRNEYTTYLLEFCTRKRAVCIDSSSIPAALSPSMDDSLIKCLQDQVGIEHWNQIERLDLVHHDLLHLPIKLH